MYIEQTNVHVTGGLIYCSLSIAYTCFSANASSLGSCHLVPAKLHKRVHVILVGFVI